MEMKKPNWIILGPTKSWETAIEHQGIWGLKEMLYPEWKAMEKRDILFFHVTSPITGIIGVGKFDTRFIQDKPLWPEEIKEKRLIYPLKFQFDIEYIIERDRWEKDRIKPPLTIQEMRRGVNILSERTIRFLYIEFLEKFKFDILIESTEETPLYLETKETKEISINHKKVQEIIFEIGKLNRYVSEKEYPMNSERLDVVWRRIERSTPTYVFEVNIGGDIYHALGKLKHAFDLWNSNIFLVSTNEDINEADKLLEGTFHEIKDKIKKITISKINELYKQKSKWLEIEREIGLI
jgi:predicted RNA-binding protein